MYNDEHLSELLIRCFIFEIYSAGYTDGFNDEHNDVNDVVTS